MRNPAEGQNCRNVICEMTPGRYSTPRFCVFSSGVTSTACARPVIFTGGPQFFMHGFRIPERLLGLFAVIVVEPALVRHLHLAPGFLRQDKFVVDDIVEIEHVGDDRIQLVVAEGLRVTKRHRPADVVEYT